jgi:hypothetical protein
MDKSQMVSLLPTVDRGNVYVVDLMKMNPKYEPLQKYFAGMQLKNLRSLKINDDITHLYEHDVTHQQWVLYHYLLDSFIVENNLCDYFKRPEHCEEQHCPYRSGYMEITDEYYHPLYYRCLRYVCGQCLDEHSSTFMCSTCHSTQCICNLSVSGPEFNICVICHDID